MKTIIIKLTTVEAAMLLELKKDEKEFGDMNKLIKDLINSKYKELRL